MSGTWLDLTRELYLSRSDCRERGDEWDIADARAAVAKWIGVPEPRTAPDDLISEVLKPHAPSCLCGMCGPGAA